MFPGKRRAHDAGKVVEVSAKRGSTKINHEFQDENGSLCPLHPPHGERSHTICQAVHEDTCQRCPTGRGAGSDFESVGSKSLTRSGPWRILLVLWS